MHSLLVADIYLALISCVDRQLCLEMGSLSVGRYLALRSLGPKVKSEERITPPAPAQTPRQIAVVPNSNTP